MAAEVTGATLLELLPQQEPFRFVDEIVEVDEEHIVARYTFRPDADFYRGHFPGNAHGCHGMGGGCFRIVIDGGNTIQEYKGPSNLYY